MCFPILGSRCHSASVIPFICSAEITRVVTFVPKRKTVQEACCGRGNFVLKSVSKSSSELHSHSLTLPKERDGISVSAFSTPRMCTGVRGHVCLTLSRKASARTSRAATRNLRDAILVTQLIIGELSLNSAICLCARSGAIPSRHSHRSSSPAISRSELLILPLGLLKDTRSADMSVGHCRRKTVGGSADSSPSMTPLTPWLEASTMPM
jgi:hypothetical protein